MKPEFYKLSLKKRIQLLYIFLAVLCISVTGVFSYTFAARSIERNALELKQGILNKSVQVMDEHLRHIVVSSFSFMLGESFEQVMKDVRSNNPANYYQNLSLLQTSLDQLKLVEPLIDATYLNTPIGDFFSTRDFPDRTASFTDKYGAYLQQPGWNTLWLVAHESELFPGKGRVLSLLLKPTVIDNFYFSNVYMVVNMKEAAMRSILEQDLMNNQVQLFLLHKDGTMVIEPETQRYDFNAEEEFVGRFNGDAAGDFNYTNAKVEELLVNYSTLSMNEDWVMVSIQSKADLLHPLKQIRWLVFGIMLICTLVALALSNLLASALLGPLNKLQRLMAQVEYNDLNVRFQSRYDDEVTAVGHKFNRMLDQIQVLIQEVRTSEQEKHKSEVKALQAQVDPHFLYNTLNTIFWKSENGEKKDVSEMIVALSLLFRLGLNNGKDITTLEQEIKHVRQYLELQQKCYENLFTYTIGVEDDSYLSIPLLKILLQPLVENSILHGFRDKTGSCRIAIEVYCRDGFLILKVTDNGCGLDAAQMEAAVNGTETEHKGYALSNLRSRLSLYYGESATIAFSSIPDTATSVTVTIPII